MSDFRLTEAEKAHPFWRRLRGYLQDELDAQRKRNDDISRDEIQTAVLRGRIQATRAFLALGDDQPIIDE
jgi:hypothetical protein